MEEYDYFQYPHLVYGAVASSAPVHATVNFEGYNSVVAASIRDPVVNGSEQVRSFLFQLILFCW